MPERITIKNTQSPGDYIVLSAAVRDLIRAQPDRFELAVQTPQPAVFLGNPNLKGLGKLAGSREVVAKYPAIHKSNQRPLHFMWGFLEYLNEALRAKAVLTEFRPDLHLTAEEKRAPPTYAKKPYWVFASGGKRDYTAKWWDHGSWQTVVDRLQGRFQLIQVGGGSHIHPRIRGVSDMVGKTQFRELMQLIYHSEGVMCIVTCLMHIAAAFNKPCVVVAGGREPWWWEAYTRENRLTNMRHGIPGWQPPATDDFVPHQYLHTIGQLKCCEKGGCWKSKIDAPGGSICTLPAQRNGQRIPKCLELITPDHVIQAVDWYYGQGVLTPGSVPALIITPEVPQLPALTSCGITAAQQTALRGCTARQTAYGLVCQLPVDETLATQLKQRTGVDRLERWPTNATKYRVSYLAAGPRILPTDVLDEPAVKGVAKDDPLYDLILGLVLQAKGYRLKDVGELVNYL